MIITRGQIGEVKICEKKCRIILDWVLALAGVELGIWLKQGRKKSAGKDLKNFRGSESLSRQKLTKRCVNSTKKFVNSPEKCIM